MADDAGAEPERNGSDCISIGDLTSVADDVLPERCLPSSRDSGCRFVLKDDAEGLVNPGGSEDDLAACVLEPIPTTTRCVDIVKMALSSLVRLFR